MIRTALFITLLTLLSACKKDTEDIIPYVRFSGTITLTDPSYFKSPFIAKQDMRGYVLGVNGLVIYRSTTESYFAYDLVCPYEKSPATLVQIDTKQDGIVVCPKCGSTYLISGGYGDLIKGPSKFPLKSYSSAYEATDNTLTIWNQ